MSEASWIEEFYPVEACNVKIEDALARSILKWSGFTKEALAKHEITTAPVLTSSHTCALCFHFMDTSRTLCGYCPLYEERGASCFTPYKREKRSPYHAYTIEGDPIPMLELMERCK